MATDKRCNFLKGMTYLHKHISEFHLFVLPLSLPIYELFVIFFFTFCFCWTMYILQYIALGLSLCMFVCYFTQDVCSFIRAVYKAFMIHINKHQSNNIKTSNCVATVTWYQSHLTDCRSPI